MDGIHDLGGKHGFGNVMVEHDEPPFHERWEASVFAMMQAAAAAGAFSNPDRFRHAIERVDPVAYLAHGYYGRWLGAVETLLVEADLVSRQELDARAVEHGASPDDLVAARPADNPDPRGPAPAGIGSPRPLDQPPKFSIGERVRTTRIVRAGHTRLPAYARDKVGTVIRLHDGWVLPDTSAHGLGENPVHLYTVQFDGTALWGGGDPNIKVSLDLFEPYLNREEGHD